MILSRRVALNDQYLDTLYGSIAIRSIEFKAPKDNIQTANRMSGIGQRIASHIYESMDVVVKWAMNVPKTDLIMRRRIYEDVCSWAMQTGWLTANMLSVLSSTEHLLKMTTLLQCLIRLRQREDMSRNWTEE